MHSSWPYPRWLDLLCMGFLRMLKEPSPTGYKGGIGKEFIPKVINQEKVQ